MGWLTVFSILLFSGLLTYWIQSNFSERFSIVFVSLIMIIVASAMISNSVELMVFSAGAVIGLLTDILGVYVGNWYYHTKNGYNYWIGFAWGVVVLSIYLMQSASIWFLLMLVLFSGWILYTTKNKWPQKNFEWFYMFIKFIGFFINPALYVLAMTLGIIIEYLAVEIFKVWSYPRINYLLIGINYSMLQLIVVYWATNRSNLFEFNSTTVYLSVVVLLYILQYSFKSLHKKEEFNFNLLTKEKSN